MKTLIIAEAGENHNGSLDLAYKLIDNLNPDLRVSKNREFFE